MNYSELLSGDKFSFPDNPDVTYVKMSRTTYRPVFTQDQFPTPVLIKTDPEVIVTHDGFTTFTQLSVGDTFRYVQRPTLQMVKTGATIYRMLNHPNTDYGDLADCLVVRL